jgi:hypothetical protein
MRKAALFLLVVLPGFAAVVVCGYYLFQDWAALISAFARLERVTQSGGDLRSVVVAQAYDNVYRINCFADGVGVMLGAILFAIGLHGLCVFREQPDHALAEAPALHKRMAGPVLALVATMTALVVCGSLIQRIGESNALRRAIVRGDAGQVKRLVAQGVDVNDGLWWGSRPLEVARTQTDGKHRPVVVRVLKEAGARE